MKTVIGVILLVLAGVLAIFQGAAMLEPSVVRIAYDPDPTLPGPPWQHHVKVLAAIALAAWAGIRFLRGGILDRLVRGRGITPAPR